MRNVRLWRGLLGVEKRTVIEDIEFGLPRVFRTAEFESIYAASCEFMYSMRTSCGVR